MNDAIIQLYGLILAAVTALGTFALAVLALYGESIRRWLYRPKLTIKIAKKEPFIHSYKDETSKESGSDVVSIRIGVENSGRGTAIGCSCLVEKVLRKQDGTDLYYQTNKFMPTPFKWVGLGMEQNSTNILPHVPAYFECGIIREPVSPVQEESTESAQSEQGDCLYVAIADPSGAPTFLRLGTGVFAIPFVVCAESLRRPRTHILWIMWSGKKANQRDNSNFHVKIVDHSSITEAEDEQ